MLMNSIIVNVLWIVMAYFVGSINFSIILTYFSDSRENIRNLGSKNAGATNALRVYGWKFGLLIFILDTSKSFWFALTGGLLQLHIESFNSLLPQVATLFVIIGHIFPIFFSFKGGKGAATLLGMISSISLLLAIVGTILFFIVVLWTRYVSVGSIIVPYWLSALSFIPYFNGWYDSAIKCGPFWLSPVTLFIACLIVTISHYKNIQNLFLNKERKIDLNFINNKKNKISKK